MAKPKWLVEAEKKKQSIKFKPKTCGECKYLGKPVKIITVKGIGKTELYECAIHPGCFNNVHSMICDDWKLNS